MLTSTSLSVARKNHIYSLEVVGRQRGQWSTLVKLCLSGKQPKSSFGKHDGVALLATHF